MFPVHLRSHWIFLLLPIVISACAEDKVATDKDNGIYVGRPKIYDDRSLQQQLLTLGGRLAQLSGIDQNTLITRLGGVQGASSTQVQAALQANGVPLPGVTTTGLTQTPSVAQTTGNTTSNAPTGLTTTTNNQTVTTTPSNTMQTVTAAPTITPAPAALPTIPSYTLPSTFSASSLDTLNEEMELSYEMINLQLLLQGSLDDDYTAQSEAKRHVTIGFPISISTPYKYRDDIAEVEVSVCNPDRRVANSEPPTLETILPREKTYNVASLQSASIDLGAGAVIANVVNVGGSFLWSHETYYLVRQQDTVALQREASTAQREADTAQRETGKPEFECRPVETDDDPTIGATPVTFAWQFRPVLGQDTIQQGMRQTFAQISFPPSETDPSGTDTVDELPSKMAITTCWRKYDADSGIARKYRSCGPPRVVSVSTVYDTTNITAIHSQDNEDGTVTVKVTGRFPIGTQVGLGDTYLAAGSPDFENTGSFIRFTAPGQLIATRGARLMSPDGSEAEIEPRTQPKNISDCRAGAPYNGIAKVTPYNVSQVEIDIHPRTCMYSPDVSDDYQYPVVAILAGKEFGLSDAPFRKRTSTSLSFLAPASLVQGQTSLKLKRLFLDDSAYETPYQISHTDNLYQSLDIAVVDSSKDSTTFLVTGSRLGKANIEYPSLDKTLNTAKTLHPDSTHLQFVLTSTQVASTKAVEVQLHTTNTAPIYLALPAVPAPGTDTGKTRTLNASGVTVLESTDQQTTFVITGSKLAGATFLFPAPSLIKNLDNTQDSYLEFTLTKAILSTTKQVIIKPAPSASTDAKDNPPIIVALPPLHDWKANLDKHAAISKGSTDPFTITGTNLQSIVAVRYLGKQVPFTCAPDGTSITINPLPAGMVVSPGLTRLEIISSDGTRQTYDVTVSS